MLTRLLAVAALAAIPGSALAGPAYTAGDVAAHFASAAECAESGTCAVKGKTRSVCIGAQSACAGDAASTPGATTATVADPGAFDMLVTFDLGSSRLSPQAKENLTEFARAMKSDKLKGATFNIDGHTDARGTEAYNMTLSDRRAESVINYLETLGVPRSRLVAHGYGETQPRVADPFAAINRRVEATLHLQ